MTDCIIVGGGIIGLSVAYELSRRGVSVTVLEQDEWGGQASAAAAGMLAPLKEFNKPGPVLDLGMASLTRYSEWVQELQDETGHDVQLCLDGLITVAMDEQEAELLRAKYSWQNSAGYDLAWLDRKALLELEPLLSPDVEAGTFSAGEGHVNNRLLLQVLVTACQQRGVTLVKGAVVTSFLTGSGRVLGVMTSAGAYQADVTVIAAGAWANIIGGWLGLSIPVRPVRGQIAAVSSVGIPLRRIIFGSTGYIVPKKEGKLVIGATEDEAGYRREVTLAGLANVCNGVLPYLPALRKANFLQAWAGLRPATIDGQPILGPVPGWDGLVIGGGHFRNGILLSPITAQLIAGYITAGRAEPLESFLLERFTT